MIVIGAFAWSVALLLYALVIAGLIAISVRLAQRQRVRPELPLHAGMQACLRITIVTLLLAPVLFGVLYFPINLVSSDGTRVIATHPRFVADIWTAARLALASSSVLAVIGVTAFALMRRTPQRASVP